MSTKRYERGLHPCEAIDHGVHPAHYGSGMGLTAAVDVEPVAAGIELYVKAQCANEDPAGTIPTAPSHRAVPIGKKIAGSAAPLARGAHEAVRHPSSPRHLPRSAPPAGPRQPSPRRGLFLYWGPGQAATPVGTGYSVSSFVAREKQCS
jgi:hypothetical protein